MVRYLFISVSLLFACNGFSQTFNETISSPSDTIPPDFSISVAKAREVVHQATRDKLLWSIHGGQVQTSLIRLLQQTKEPYDSIESLLTRMNFQSVDITTKKIASLDSLEIRWLNDSTFIIDSVGWSMDLMLHKEILLKYPVDLSTLSLSDSILDESGMLDSTLFTPDTLELFTIDTVAIETLQLPMHQYINHRIIPPVRRTGFSGRSYISPDSGYIVIRDTSFIWYADPASPFKHLSGRYQLDSLQRAMETLLEYTERRDSTRLMVNDMYGKKSAIWITTGNNNSHRFWVKNYKNDSITLWIGNPASNEISLILEDDIDVNRMTEEVMNHLPKSLKQPDRTLATMSLLEPNPYFWDYQFSSAFTFNQTYLSNWTKGGESSLTTMLDIIGGATYNNTKANTQWINSARLKYGTLVTQEKGLRKNNDLFEINSKFNRNASGKIGLSASFYMKNQIAKGYNYPNDSVEVSKFLNPASLTIGLGAEYKPFKHTTLNMAPLSYKNTFVLDTAHIDQTKHGIDPDKRVKQELGTQVVLMNTFTPMEDLTIASNLRLFSNYLNRPGNIDIDWEMILDIKINWFFTVRLNLHMIYDDDVRFSLYDSDNQPILMPDGSQKKVAKTQFREFIGLSMLFKF